VNKAFADRYFPGSSAIGRKFWTGGRDRPATEIVGVVANSRTADLTQDAEPEIYLSLWQASAFSKHLLVRTSADPRTIMASIRQEIHGVLPTAAVENMKTLEDVRGDSLATRTFAMQLLAGFAIAGSVLTLVGTYGVLSLSVASRRRELAIRAAVGAETRDIRNLIIGEGLRLVAGCDARLLGAGPARNCRGSGGSAALRITPSGRCASDSECTSPNLARRPACKLPSDAAAVASQLAHRRFRRDEQAARPDGREGIVGWRDLSTKVDRSRHI
jgi:hypothetical protein